MKYNFRKIESKWQKIWNSNSSLWKAKDSNKNKIYILDMFPYPSGDGLHAGHIEGYTGTDILSRYFRMKGCNVLHPMGWDAFGLPAENYALKMKKNPMIFVPKNIEKFKKQMEKMGFSYDWQREINTTDSDYYRWTQWMFLKMYNMGLAYEAEAPINFCPSCKTGLAREEVINGRCERCDSITEIKYLKQWHLKITKYADRLLDDLEELKWPESIKDLQRNWIGRSNGHEINFSVEDKAYNVKVFTTRIDTIYGATFLVLAPEHPLALKISRGDYYFNVEKYLQKTLPKPERDRLLNKEITGVFTGNYVVHPLTGRRIPVWISEYVLFQYGTGAIMGVPGHDKRDYEFAKKFDLPIEKVVEPADEKTRNEIFEGYGILKDSEEFTGLSSVDAIEQIGKKLIERGTAVKNTYYKLRDWVFSRQRYWGEPIPIIKCVKCGNVPIQEKDLPVVLPKITDFKPTGAGESPLKKAKKWVKVKCPKCGSWAEREINTMPQWAGSCWYYLRFIDSKNKKVFANPSKLKHWLPVDIYVGGAEHAVLHLLYARFWHKVFYDIGLIPVKEPFLKLVNQGMILGEDNEKMSKSRGNVVNPDNIIKNFGADTLRMFEMFIGPFDSAKPWAIDSIKGIFRFLNNVWNVGNKLKTQNAENLVFGAESDKSLSASGVKTTTKKLELLNGQDREMLIALNQTIKKVGEDIENFKFNTAISSMMEILDLLRKRTSAGLLSAAHFSVFLKLLFPLAPHISQELWQIIGKKTLLDKEKWPEYNKKYLAKNEKIIIVQINGKRRLDLMFPAEAKFEEIKAVILKNPKIKTHLKGKRVKKTIFAQDKIVNFVTK